MIIKSRRMQEEKDASSQRSTNNDDAHVIQSYLCRATCVAKDVANGKVIKGGQYLRGTPAENAKAPERREATAKKKTVRYARHAFIYFLSK